MPGRQDDVVAALDRVTNSGVFHASKRAQEFLRYIVLHALHGELDHLKERSIGCVVFGRPPDYDTGSDAIVRVTANDVRKRLDHYYAHDGTSEAVRFEVPIGSYIPEFRSRLQWADPVTSSAPREESVRPNAASSWVSASWRKIVIGGLSAVVLLQLTWALRPAKTSSAAMPQELRSLPWNAIFDGERTPQLILGDSAVGSVRIIFNVPPVSLEDYANRRELTSSQGVPPEMPQLRSVLAHYYTSLADARIAARFSGLAASAGRSVATRFARDLQLSEFHEGANLVLLGSFLADPWVRLFEDQMDFDIRWDPTEHKQFIAIKTSTRGDPQGLAKSVGTGMTGHAYAVLALTSGLDNKGRVLIVEGTNMEGTEVAADLMFNHDRLSNVLKGCGVDPGDRNARFEVLMELQSTASSTSQSRVLAARCKSGK